MASPAFTPSDSPRSGQSWDARARENLRALTSDLMRIRAQMHTLQAEEAAILSRADELASRIAAEGAHSDHGEFAHRAIAAELGTAVHESDRAMAAKIDRACSLVQRYPSVLDALKASSISLAHAHAIAEAGSIIQRDDARAQYASASLEIAEVEVLGRARPIIKELAEQFAERTIDERHVEARSHRMVSVVDREDGMADLIACISAPFAYGIKDRLNRMAREVKLAETEAVAGVAVEQTPRSMDQIRADLLTDLLLAADPNAVAASGATGASSIQARVQVILAEESVAQTVPAAGAEPATLEGYGPIDTESARFFAASAPHWERITVSPTSGSVISVDTYRPTAEQRRFLGARDLHCRFPGCRVALNRCDIDHTVDAALGGPTSTDNLAHLCRGHHTLKHHSAWSVRQEPDGTLIWMSPTGRACSEPPPSRVRFRRHPEPATHSGPQTTAGAHSTRRRDSNPLLPV